MNERIRELIKTKSTILFPGTDTVDCEISDIEKFAELIVKECTQLVEDNLDPHNAWVTPGYIKEHFGIER
jgi:hypothetical protein